MIITFLLLSHWHFLCFAYLFVSVLMCLFHFIFIFQNFWQSFFPETFCAAKFFAVKTIYRAKANVYVYMFDCVCMCWTCQMTTKLGCHLVQFKIAINCGHRRSANDNESRFATKHFHHVRFARVLHTFERSLKPTLAHKLEHIHIYSHTECFVAAFTVL